MAMVASNPETKPTETPEEPSQQGEGGGGEEVGGYNVCFQKLAVDAAGGAFMGSIFGFGSGLVKRKGFKESLGEAGSSAKSFAILSGVHSFVSCFLKKLRGKDDAINAGIAGCVTGLALSVPGTPQTLLQGCVTFGAFSFILEEFNKRQVAVALPLSRSLEQEQNSFPQIPFPVLPPFTLPSPFFKGFSALPQSELHSSSRS
ncbi:hypothetical protein SUGI_0523570, partial [Cryptomeria japonica]